MDSAGAKAGLRAKRATGSSTPAGKAAAAAKPLRPERRRAFSAAPRSRTLESHGYIWVRQIGKGAFGRAILVRDLKHQEFVVKEVALSNTTTAEKDLARMEIKVLQKVGHPNVVRYIEHFEDSKHLYIVMEYAESGDLGKLLKGAVLPMSEEEILDYFVQMCMALQHIHSKQILHRDLKPQNLFLCKNKKVVKVGDFGISTILRSSSAVAKTQCGTPYYFSPELCQHKPYNNKSDVWSLGCLLYEMMALRRPFDGANLRLLMANICKAKYPALPSRWSAELRQLLKEMLSKDPNKRPSITAILDMDFVRKRLEQFVPLHDSVYGDAGDAAAGAGPANALLHATCVHTPRMGIAGTLLLFFFVGLGDGLGWVGTGSQVTATFPAGHRGCWSGSNAERTVHMDPGEAPAGRRRCRACGCGCSRRFVLSGLVGRWVGASAEAPKDAEMGTRKFPASTANLITCMSVLYRVPRHTSSSSSASSDSGEAESRRILAAYGIRSLTTICFPSLLGPC